MYNLECVDKYHCPILCFTLLETVDFKINCHWGSFFTSDVCHLKAETSQAYIIFWHAILIHWKNRFQEQIHAVISANLRGGAPGVRLPLRPKMFSISCGFSENLAKLFPPPEGWCLLQGILDPPLVIVSLAEPLRNFLDQRILHYNSFYKIFLLGMQTKPFKYEKISQYFTLKLWNSTSFMVLNALKLNGN